MFIQYMIPSEIYICIYICILHYLFIVFISFVGYTLFHFYIKKYIIKTLSCRSCALDLVLYEIYLTISDNGAQRGARTHDPEIKRFCPCKYLYKHLVLFIVFISFVGYTLFHFYIEKYIIKTLSCRSCALDLVL